MADKKTAESDETKPSDTDYKVLARKYRPVDFSSLIGQEAMVRTLSNAIAAGRLAHAFILTGVRGVGKTTTARIIAKALNCEKSDGPTVHPCGVCSACDAIARSSHVDVLEMDAASRTGVDDIREVIDSVQYAPVSARFKVYIIDEVHMLTRNAFNALLKTLEEPPARVKFIFATTEIRKLPVTVLSRCQRFDLRRVGAERLTAHLTAIAEQEGAHLEEGAMRLIVRAGEGSVRDALSLLDQAIAHGGGRMSESQVRDMLGLADRSLVLSLFETLMKGDIAATLKQIRGQYNQGADPLSVVNDLLEVTHWLTSLKVTGHQGDDLVVSEAEKEFGKLYAEKLPMSHLSRVWQMLMKGLGEVQKAPSPIAAAEMLLVRIAYAADLPTPAEALARPDNAKAHSQTGTASTGANPVGSLAQALGAPGAASTHQTATIAPSQQRIPAPTQTQDTVSQKMGSQAATLLKYPSHSGEMPKHPMPVSFEHMVQLFRDEREAPLALHFSDNTRLVEYRPGQIRLNLTDKVPSDFAGRVRHCLETWTGTSWSVILENEGGGQTLQEQQQAYQSALESKIMADQKVRALLDVFPGAKLVKMREIQDFIDSDDTGADGAVRDSDDFDI